MHQKPSIRYKCIMDKQNIKYNYKKDKSCFTFAIKVVKCSVWTCSNTQGSCQVIKELREARPASSTHNASALPHGKFVGDKYAPNGLNIGRSTTIVFIYCNDVSIIDHGTIQLRAFSTNPKMFRCVCQKLSIPFNNYVFPQCAELTERFEEGDIFPPVEEMVCPLLFGAALHIQVTIIMVRCVFCYLGDFLSNWVAWSLCLSLNYSLAYCALFCTAFSG